MWKTDSEIAAQVGDWWYFDLSGRQGIEDCETDLQRVEMANAALMDRGINLRVAEVDSSNEIEYRWLVA